jgi:hypothetical protein
LRLPSYNLKRRCSGYEEEEAIVVEVIALKRLLCRVGLDAKDRANLKMGPLHTTLELHVASGWKGKCLATFSSDVSAVGRNSMIDKR